MERNANLISFHLHFIFSFICVFLVLGVLDGGLSLVNVTCSSKIHEWDRHDPIKCYLIDFPTVSNNNVVTYNFNIDYARTQDIIFLEFVSSGGGVATVKQIPNDILITFPNVRVFTMTTNLEELDSNDFSQAKNLMDLSLSHNKLKIIKNTVFSPLAWKAKSMPHPIDVMKISLDGAFPLHILSRLYLAQNEISEIEDNSFYCLYSLFELHLQGNRLKVIRQRTFTGLSSLRFLDISYNEIGTIENGAFEFPELQKLLLRKNQLKRLSNVVFHRLLKLETIDLIQNGLEHIGRSLYELSSVKNILLGENHIRDIDLAAFAQLPNLQQLELQESGFSFATTKIDTDARRQWNSSLCNLDLSDNNLIDANELNKLRNFPHLESLNLDGNLFTNFTIGTLKAPVGEHQTIDNALSALSKRYVVQIVRWFTRFEIGGRDPNSERRTLTDILPALSDISLRRIKMDCVDIVSFARELQTKQVKVKHDCGMKIS